MKNGKYAQICKVSLLLLLTVFFGRSVVFAQQYDTLLRLKDFRRYNMLHIFLANADDKPEEFKKIAEWVNRNGDDTEKEMLLSELENNQLKSAGESIEKQIAFSEQYVLKANKSNNHYLLFRLYYRICDRYQALGLYNKSIENSLYCVDELKKGGNGTYFEQSWPLYQLGENFFRFGDYDRALELSLVAYKYYAINNRNPAWFVKACSNLIGVIYLKAEKFDSAKNWLDSTLYYSGIQKDTLWMGIAIGNLGTISYRKNDYVSAIPNFTKAIAYCQKWEMWDNISPFATRLADSYFRTGQTQLVQAALDLAAEANKHDFKLVNRVDYFKVASNWYRSQGNSKLALEYADSNRLYQMRMDEEFSELNK